MSAHVVRFDAVDTLMFRDGRSFNQNDAGASEAASVFPPFPPTLVGAVRATLWNALGSWDKEQLGDGTDWQKPGTLGPLRFSAPIVFNDSEPVFPMPLHVVEGLGATGANKKPEMAFLKPAGDYECDLGGNIKLPTAENDHLAGIATILDRWVNATGMTAILEGNPPAAGDLLHVKDLWQREPRVGIGIDRNTRTTSDGRLYMASHVRLAEGVSLQMSLAGWRGDDMSKGHLRPVAGEHRMAHINLKSSDGIALPTIKVDLSRERHCLVAISPVVPNWDNAGKVSIAGIDDTRLVGACLGKPVPIGGWDSAQKRPIPLRNCIPAGSVWFMEAGGNAAQVPDCIGSATQWGFGQVLVGKW